MKTILSTKKLNYSQRERLLAADLAVVDVDFIGTKSIPFTSEAIIENAIFTSKRGVKAVFDKGINVQNAYCVGERTSTLLKSNIGKVSYTANNAAALADWIIANCSDTFFQYFCAKDRLDTLPNQLTASGVNWTEIPVYETILTPKAYNQQFDGVLFFSPSGVESYFSINQAPEHSFCIGNTTAASLKKYTSNFTVASITSVENVLVKTIKHFKK